MLFGFKKDSEGRLALKPMVGGKDIVIEMMNECKNKMGKHCAGDKAQA